MSKFLVTWELDESVMPNDPKELVEMLSKLVAMVRNDLKVDKDRDWDILAFGVNGYTMVEGNAFDLYRGLKRYRPYMIFNVQEVSSMHSALEVFKS